MGRAGKRHVDGVYRILSARKVLLRYTLQSVELPRRQARKQVAELSVSGAALAGGDLRARFAASSETRKSTARSEIDKGPCARRALPPAPCYPYAKVINSARRYPQGFLCLAYTPPPSGAGPAITRMQKLSAAQKAARRVPPPIRGRPRYYPYAKVISGAKSGPPCTPPHPGQAPLLPVCKSYQQCTKRPP